MVVLRGLLAGTLCLAQVVSGTFRTSLTIKDFREQMTQWEVEEQINALAARDVDPSTLYPARTISVPIDHFHNDSLYEPHTNDTFELRYWFDPSHYKKGGPVIVLQSGETSGVGRLPFLQKGIVAMLAQATGGLGVILEHRYYGKSFPTANLSTESLRFLTTDQSVADMAFFAKHVVFEGLEHLDLTAPKTPYIAYGGSYAGAFVAFLRKLYPDVYWGAICSSGVTEAIYDYWQYYEAHRLFAPHDCVVATQKLTHAIDNILLGAQKSGSDDQHVQRLKAVFGLGNLTRSDDFANTVSFGIAGLQGTNWDPAENSTDFGLYCNNVSSTTLLYPGSVGHTAEVQELLDAAGYGDELDTLTNQMLNYAGYVNLTTVQGCKEETQDSCFTTYNSTFFQQDDIKQTWRAWPYQYCTEWGYLQTGSGVPATQLPLISRLIDLNYTSVICREAFNISTPPNVEAVNKHGGFGISYPRLAIIDGEKDPWRAATPHAIGLPPRPNTIDEPFILIKDGVHHWDENGLFPNETTPELPPKPVKKAQRAEVEFVKAWMKEWKKAKCTKSGAGHGGH
ncbi:serine carboxypeptidase S28-domain-containing protein [Apodospora peruviana]|uniref:Serine carboxypeptidase S28-domain-containing protein n=1 Tax=Apodospora peruviana TaxID=516989 RepID=A0AAE0IT97_9PEZI|nr:serine carboxypeptidase S28-domain-containing protein [Apodospora peruviana]